MAELSRRAQRFKYLVVLDFEATCNEPKNTYPQEVIEWPAMIIDVSKRIVLKDYFHFYVKPKVHPMLSPFCTQLTGITQPMVDNGSDIIDVVKQWNMFCYKNELLPDINNKSCICTHGDWDLKTLWPMQANNKFVRNQLQYQPALFHSWINVKKIYSQLYNKRGRGMMRMLNDLGIKHQGRHHSGIDDVRNICQIVLTLLNDGA
eukprot:UN08005